MCKEVKAITFILSSLILTGCYCNPFEPLTCGGADYAVITTRAEIVNQEKTI